MGGAGKSVAPVRVPILDPVGEGGVSSVGLSRADVPTPPVAQPTGMHGSRRIERA
jgi:hypothetical protein